MLIKIAAVLAVVGGFSYLFLRSVQNARSEPYVVERQYLESWRLVLQTPGAAASPMLVMQPPLQFGSGLFDQIFSRMMESLKGATGGGVPVILRGEYERSLAGRYTPEALLDAARAAGIESSAFTPQCVAVRRISEPGVTRQVFFVIFEWPAVAQFREQIARDIQAVPMAGAFRPTSLSPIMIIAATDADFARWLPISARAPDDCVAPIEID
jgi:hypothetical protein